MTSFDCLWPFCTWAHASLQPLSDPVFLTTLPLCLPVLFPHTLTVYKASTCYDTYQLAQRVLTVALTKEAEVPACIVRSSVRPDALTLCDTLTCCVVCEKSDHFFMLSFWTQAEELHMHALLYQLVLLCPCLTFPVCSRFYCFDEVGLSSYTLRSLTLFVL